MCTELTTTERRIFLAVWLAAVTATAALLWGVVGRPVLSIIVFVVGMAGFALAMMFPPVLSAAHVAMLRLSRPMQRLIAGVLLTAIYVVIVIPIGLVSRWWRPDPLARAWQQDTESYWRDENADTSVDRRFRPF